MEHKMKKHSNSLLIAVGLSIVSIMFINFTLTAQDIVFTATENNLGLNSTLGQFGTGWADFDGDGDLDLLIVGQGTSKHVLYMNNNGVFKDTSKLIRSSVGDYGKQPVWFDYNGDNKLDFILASGLYLFKQTDSGFYNVSSKVGLSTIKDKDSYWSVAVGDYDMDGDLDIAVAGGSQGTSKLMGPLVILRYDDSVFTNATEEVFGVISLESWGITWVDFDNDGDLDLWAPTIRTPGEKNAMLINNQGAEFIYGTTDVFIADSLNDALVSGWADYNNDGYMDLMTTPFNTTPDTSYNHEQFWRNNGNGTLTDIGPQLGFTSAPNARGLAWGDYDNDGDLDLLMGKRNPDTLELWRNDAGQFVNVATEAGVAFSDLMWRGVHFVDYDNDGFLDILLANGDPAKAGSKLLHNTGNSNHWIVIKPKGTGKNTAGIGARVRVVAGGLSMIRDIEGTGPGLTSGKLWAHFGLGSATQADSVIIRWPTGTIDVSTNVAADRYWVFEEGVGVGVNDKSNTIPSGYMLGQNYPNPFNPTTTIQFSLPVQSSVRLVLVNVLGQVVKELANGDYVAGSHQVKLDASNLSTGIYFYKLQADNFVDVKKLVIMK